MFSINISYAGPEATPIDYLPDITRISFDKDDVVLNNIYRIVGGQWSQWESPVFDDKSQERKTVNSIKKSCSLPKDIISDVVEGNVSKQYEILKCGKDAIWFATESYCSEGFDDQAILYRYLISADSIEKFKNALPKCNGVVDIVVKDKEVWIATNHPGEYGAYAGEGVIRYNFINKTVVEKIPASRFSSPVLSAMNAVPTKDILWIATSKGIDKFFPETGKVESRYFQLNLKSNKQMYFALSEKSLSNDEHWMEYNLFYIPMDNTREFVQAWRRSKKNKYGIMPEVSELFPFYLEGLVNLYSLHDLKNNNKSYEFLSILDRFSGFNEPRADFKAFLSRVNIDKLPAVVAKQVLIHREKFGMQNAKIDTENYFNELTRQYFFPDDVWKRKSNLKRSLCELMHKDKDRFRKVVDLYVNNKVTRNVDGGFFYSCFAQRSGFEYAYLAIPAFVSAMYGSISVGQDDTCWVFSHYAKPEFRVPDAVIASLHAQVRIKQQSGIQSYSYVQCKMASYWLANQKAGIQRLLDEIYQNSELKSEARDVLQEITQQKLTSISELRVWWKNNKNNFKPRDKKYYMDYSTFHSIKKH